MPGRPGPADIPWDLFIAGKTSTRRSRLFAIFSPGENRRLIFPAGPDEIQPAMSHQKFHLLSVPRNLLLAAAFWLAAASPLTAQGPPLENPYDVLGKFFRPFTNVLMAGGRDPERAMELEFRIAEVTGRLPSQFAGATLRAWVENPDKLKLEAPVFGEKFVVCRNGGEVWATPGDKVEFLFNQFKQKPPPSSKPNTPLFIPVNAQQAIFLVALFEIANRGVAEVDTIDGKQFRVISGSLMPDLAKAAKAEDFRAAVWIDSDYRPRRMEIARKDFTTTVDFLKTRFLPSLPASTWQAPADDPNIFRIRAEELEAVLYVVVNSLHTDSNEKPWQIER